MRRNSSGGLRGTRVCRVTPGGQTQQTPPRLSREEAGPAATAAALSGDADGCGSPHQTISSRMFRGSLSSSSGTLKPNAPHLKTRERGKFVGSACQACQGPNARQEGRYKVLGKAIGQGIGVLGEEACALNRSERGSHGWVPLPWGGRRRIETSCTGSCWKETITRNSSVPGMKAAQVTTAVARAIAGERRCERGHLDGSPADEAARRHGLPRDYSAACADA